jgi:hypothetical protein
MSHAMEALNALLNKITNDLDEADLIPLEAVNCRLKNRLRIQSLQCERVTGAFGKNG